MARHFDPHRHRVRARGSAAAVQAAKLKKSVLVVERGRRVGSVCVHRKKDDITAEDLRRIALKLRRTSRTWSRLRKVWPELHP
jgi:NAD(P) transhydrogenase